MSRELLALLWVGVAIAAGAAEVLTLNLVFIMVAGGALTAALVSAVFAGPAASVVVFSLATLVLLVAARPPLKSYLSRTTPDAPMHAQALIGERAQTLTEVDSASGQIRINGETWSARATQESLPPGTLVYVRGIEGATALVGKEPLPPMEGKS